MRTIGVGVIGWGFMGRMHTHALKSLSLHYAGAPFEVRLAHLCTRRAQVAEEAARREGFARWSADYHALLDDPEVEVVSVCTPNDAHEDIAIAALRAGKHVYIDKPLAVTADSAERVAAAAREAKGFGAMAFNNRCTPATLRAKQLVDEGRIGEVLSFQGRYLHSGSIDPDKPAGWKLGAGGGVLLDLGSHALDLLVWLCGWPEAVFCAERTLYDRRPDPRGGFVTALSEDQALMLLRLKNGAMGSVEASKIATGSNDDLTIEVRGTKGALRWDAMQPSWLEFYDATTPEVPLGGERGFTRIETVARYPTSTGAFPPIKNALGWDRGHIHCYYTFLSDVCAGRRPENGIEEGARLQRLMDRIGLSAKEGRWVDADA